MLWDINHPGVCRTLAVRTGRVEVAEWAERGGDNFEVCRCVAAAAAPGRFRNSSASFPPNGPAEEDGHTTALVGAVRGRCQDGFRRAAEAVSSCLRDLSSQGCLDLGGIQSSGRKRAPERVEAGESPVWAGTSLAHVEDGRRSVAVAAAGDVGDPEAERNGVEGGDVKSAQSAATTDMGRRTEEQVGVDGEVLLKVVVWDEGAKHHDVGPR